MKVEYNKRAAKATVKVTKATLVAMAAVDLDVVPVLADALEAVYAQGMDILHDMQCCYQCCREMRDDEVGDESPDERFCDECAERMQSESDLIKSIENGSW